jgi:hypothetical protein
LGEQGALDETNMKPTVNGMMIQFSPRVTLCFKHKMRQKMVVMKKCDMEASEITFSGMFLELRDGFDGKAIMTDAKRSLPSQLFLRSTRKNSEMNDVTHIKRKAMLPVPTLENWQII